MFEREKEKLLHWSTVQLEKERSRYQLVRLFVLATVGEIAALLIAILVPKPVADAAAFAINMEGKIALYLAAVPLLCGFLMTFTVIKFLSPNRARKILPGSFMSRYEDHSHHEDQRLVFLICAGVGGLNAIIFFFVVTWAR